jgi:hypothetical protein
MTLSLSRENKIKIVKFKKTKKDEDLTEVYNEFEKSVPELKFALGFIEEVLISIEEKANNV